MSSDSSLHHNQQQMLHSRYDYEYHIHNGYLDSREHHAHQMVEFHHIDEEMERQGVTTAGESIIRGNSKCGMHDHHRVVR